VPPPAATPPSVGAGARDAAARDVRTVDGEVEWRCGTCDRWSPLAADRCLACGSPRTGFGDPPPRPVVADDRRAGLVVASIALPGLGHLLAGRLGSGLARLVLGLSWLLGGIAIARAAAASGAAILPAVPLLLGAAIVWTGSVADAASLDRRELLRPRVLTVLTGVVLGTLVLALLATATGGAVGATG
jgi:hypothetical protein